MSMRVLRGYGPLAAALVAFLLMAILVPTRGEVVRTEQVSADEASAAAKGKSSASATDGTAGTAGSAGDTAAAAGPPGGQEGCPDRKEQVPGDTYSPPCFQPVANNGGSTAKGVTGTEISVSVRMSDGAGFQDALQQAAGVNISDTTDDIKNTMSALAEYFNTHFQFYGRKIALKFYDSKSSPLDEILGGGQEGAEADAVKVSDEIKPFAELNGSTPPFADALSRRQVLNFGVPYMSREWMGQRRPYVWSQLTDCSIVVETMSEYVTKRLVGHPASFAGPGIQGKERAYALIAPENSWYQECVSSGLKKFEGSSANIVANEKYKLSLSQLSNQATNLLAKVKDRGATTILCGCDPITLLFMTQQAKQQNYNPEWLIGGVAFTDQDIVAQLFDQDQWSHAFGVSYAGEPQPLRASYGYNAYKSVRNDEPAFSVDLIYYQMYLLALGIHMAGPNLTHQTFEQGMFAYPGGTGPLGTWKFGPQNLTPTVDSREIWWDPNATSSQNAEKGAYRDPQPGTRFTAGTWPTGEPKVFGK